MDQRTNIFAQLVAAIQQADHCDLRIGVVCPSYTFALEACAFSVETAGRLGYMLDPISVTETHVELLGEVGVVHLQFFPRTEDEEPYHGLNYPDEQTDSLDEFTFLDEA